MTKYRVFLKTCLLGKRDFLIMTLKMYFHLEWEGVRTETGPSAWTWTAVPRLHSAKDIEYNQICWLDTGFSYVSMSHEKCSFILWVAVGIETNLNCYTTRPKRQGSGIFKKTTRPPRKNLHSWEGQVRFSPLRGRGSYWYAKVSCSPTQQYFSNFIWSSRLDNATNKSML